MKKMIRSIGVIIAMLTMVSCSHDLTMGHKSAKKTASCEETEGWVVHGRWKWNSKTKSYKWVSGYKSRNKAYWVDGHYAGSVKGKKYVPGRWQ